MGNWLSLVFRYGLDRVLSERLRVVEMRKARPYLISNGDLADFGFLDWLLSAGLWILFSFILSSVLLRFVRLWFPEFYLRRPDVRTEKRA